LLNAGLLKKSILHRPSAVHFASTFCATLSGLQTVPHAVPTWTLRFLQPPSPSQTPVVQAVARLVQAPPGSSLLATGAQQPTTQRQQPTTPCSASLQSLAEVHVAVWHVAASTAPSADPASGVLGPASASSGAPLSIGAVPTVDVSQATSATNG